MVHRCVSLKTWFVIKYLLKVLAGKSFMVDIIKMLEYMDTNTLTVPDQYQGQSFEGDRREVAVWWEAAHVCGVLAYVSGREMAVSLLTALKGLRRGASDGRFRLSVRLSHSCRRNVSRGPRTNFVMI